MPPMELKVKLAKSKNVYLQNNKQKTKYRLRCLDVSK